MADDITGLILAGGRGRRIGGADKGWLEVGGKALVVNALERLRPQVATVIVSANRNLERYRSLDVDVAVVTDDPSLGDFPGPLAGMLSALRVTTTTWLAVVPCDAPGFPVDLAARLRAAVRQSNAAIAESSDGVQPTFALLRSSLAPKLAAWLRNGQRAAHQWFDSIDAVRVQFADNAAFANLNSPADFR